MSLMTSTDHLVKLQWELATTHSGITVEILGGELVVNAAAAYEHDRLANLLTFHLGPVVPKPLVVFGPAAGVHLLDAELVEYFQPDVLVHRAPAGERLIGSEVELAVEVLSPSNRARGNYAEQVVERATRFGVGWVLFIDPETRTADLRRAAAEGAIEPSYVQGLTVDTFDPSTGSLDAL